MPKHHPKSKLTQITKLPKTTPTQQHETTYQATPKTVYNTKMERPKSSNSEQQKQTQEYKQNHKVNPQVNQQPRNNKNTPNTMERREQQVNK